MKTVEKTCIFGCPVRIGARLISIFLMVTVSSAVLFFATMIYNSDYFIEDFCKEKYLDDLNPDNLIYCSDLKEGTRNNFINILFFSVLSLSLAVIFITAFAIGVYKQNHYLMRPLLWMGAMLLFLVGFITFSNMWNHGVNETEFRNCCGVFVFWYCFSVSYSYYKELVSISKNSLH